MQLPGGLVLRVQLRLGRGVGLVPVELGVGWLAGGWVWMLAGFGPLGLSWPQGLGLGFGWPQCLSWAPGLVLVEPVRVVRLLIPSPLVACVLASIPSADESAPACASRWADAGGVVVGADRIGACGTGQLARGW